MCVAVLHLTDSLATRHKRLDKYANVVALCCQLYFAATSPATPFPNELSLCDIVHWAKTLPNTAEQNTTHSLWKSAQETALTLTSSVYFLVQLPKVHMSSAYFVPQKYIIYCSTQFAQLARELVCCLAFVFFKWKDFSIPSTLFKLSHLVTSLVLSGIYY